MEQLKHECGVAIIRLLKPLSYYEQRYGTWRYGLNKLYLMMEKQHNRGQEGAGVACVNLDAPVGEEYMFRERAEGKDAITEVFKRIGKGEMTMDNGIMYLLSGPMRRRTTCGMISPTKPITPVKETHAAVINDVIRSITSLTFLTSIPRSFA